MSRPTPRELSILRAMLNHSAGFLWDYPDDDSAVVFTPSERRIPRALVASLLVGRYIREESASKGWRRYTMTRAGKAAVEAAQEQISGQSRPALGSVTEGVAR